LHVAPLQHPAAHEVASQTQAPPEHRWPAPQGLPDPHVQTPAVHPSALVGSHATHAAPPPPHAVTDGVVQVVPAQQPEVHACEHGSHLPLTHVSPAGQSGVVAHPHVSFGRQTPRPAQAFCSPVVHWTHCELIVSHTSGGGQSASIAHVPQTVVVVLLVSASVLLPTR
jgi:hypothetical protein